MKRIRTFENYRIVKNRNEIIKEAVLQVNDIYKVNTMIDIPQSLINAYVKKVKETTGKNVRQFFGDVNIAEEIVKHITQEYLNVDKLSPNFLMGGQVEGQESGQVETQAQTQVQTQVQTQDQGQVQTQDQGQVQTQVQDQGQVQTQDQGQSQSQVQVDDEFEEPQSQGQSQGQSQEDDEEFDEFGEGGDEELPI